MKYTFCPQCGEKLSEIHAGDDGMVPYCESCEVPWFDTFWSCVIVLVYNEYDEVVLSRQSYLSDTYASFTSGYMTPGETAEETAIREVKEELGLDLETLIYAGTHWFGKRDMLMHGFIGYAHRQELHLSEEVDSAEWVPALEAPKTMFPDSPGNAACAIYRKFLQMRNLAEQ
ncbi:MAG: NAD(+) diphosphatase [Raoultibacter sp.]|jgi:NAD+ diphosphatase